jgi:hypothetical protein
MDLPYSTNPGDPEQLTHDFEPLQGAYVFQDIAHENIIEMIIREWPWDIIHIMLRNAWATVIIHILPTIVGGKHQRTRA